MTAHRLTQSTEIFMAACADGKRQGIAKRGGKKFCRFALTIIEHPDTTQRKAIAFRISSLRAGAGITECV